MRQAMHWLAQALLRAVRMVAVPGTGKPHGATNRVGWEGVWEMPANVWQVL
jgi:hypothetical protein